MSKSALNTIDPAQWRCTSPQAVGISGLVDIDVTPVMNLFMILIPFLVSMAFFSHLAVQSFRLPASEGAGQAQTVDELPWTVAVTADRIALTRGEWVVGTCERRPAGPDGWAAYDTEALAGLLVSARTRQPGIERVVVAVDDGVVAAAIVSVLDRCREAGFAEVGLAEGTGLDGMVQNPREATP